MEELNEMKVITAQEAKELSNEKKKQSNERYDELKKKYIKKKSYIAYLQQENDDLKGKIKFKDLLLDDYFEMCKEIMKLCWKMEDKENKEEEIKLIKNIIENEFLELVKK